MGKFNICKDLLILDVETTGVDEKSSIIQLSAVIFTKEGKLANCEFNQYIIPYTLNWSEEAYQVHKLTKEFLVKNGRHLNDVLESFENWASCHNSFDLKKKYWLAQWSGGAFDTNMLQNAYECASKKYPFHYRVIDVSSIVRFELANRGKLEIKCGEKECAEALGIDVEDSKLHDGLYDARLSGQMLERLVRGGK